MNEINNNHFTYDYTRPVDESIIKQFYEMQEYMSNVKEIIEYLKNRYGFNDEQFKKGNKIYCLKQGIARAKETIEINENLLKELTK